jgi:hypothetical protein
LKVLFVDHAFHKRTSSSQFLLRIVEQSNDVNLSLFDPEKVSESLEEIRRVDWTDYDLVLIFQLDVLALFPLAAGIPTVIIPMYDCSGGRPKSHWALLREANAINFSHQLNAITSMFLRENLALQFFPDHAGVPQVSDFTELRVMFWERTPAELPVATAYKLIGNQAASWRLHLAPDQGNPSVTSKPPSGRLVISTWFADRSAFLDRLDEANVFICPRLREGIGMVMLEAMARGMCVIATHMPVHSEYIDDGISGLLFDPYAPVRLDLSQAASMGTAARDRVQQGYREWLAQKAAIPEFLARAAARKPTPFPFPIDFEAFVSAYCSDDSEYERLTLELLSHLPQAWRRFPQWNFDAGRKQRKISRIFARLAGWPRFETSNQADSTSDE